MYSLQFSQKTLSMSCIQNHPSLKMRQDRGQMSNHLLVSLKSLNYVQYRGSCKANCTPLFMRTSYIRNVILFLCHHIGKRDTPVFNNRITSITSFFKNPFCSTDSS